MRRVAVTGLGVVSALGVGREAHVAGLREGRCGVGQLSIANVDRLSVTIGAPASGFVGEERFGKSELALLDRTTQLALTAAAEAVAQSGLEVDEALAPRAGVAIGTALTGMETVDANYRAVYEEKKNRVHPFVVPRLMTNAGASQISMAHGLTGPAWTVSTACSSSNHAIGQAFHLIRSGGADVMLAGGAEAPLVFGVIKAWEGLRVMSKDGCRPFCETRNGMVQGEGAAVLVLEEWDRAARRGAPILAELAGFSMTADAGDIVTPSAEGAARAIRGALLDARLAPEDVGYINAHGTATAANDRTECAAIRSAFGAAAETVSVSSTKSMHGHCLGGAGAVEMAAVVLALSEGVIAPTVGLVRQDPACDLDVTPITARERRVDAALSNSFAFGGLNAVLAARRA
ncbi:beta-ketoacyl-[acyl-carrier-protein] synthase family protein [Rubrimonas cliftonensis]|uniref:Nodulation protein E n=1 Tax=Rubrimonas cliftonensis TaxID=89524 RepID=A0A1H3ZBI6_9RHOB|nr:beta-ketoacyl-[acyl-carrier-protein] synthase family protein [Rubrimonas cliftonensis]SEA20702.1 3-oxoacyl-[acyl-carrier-protein] synthase II [Rubrimonas cliftonensis]